MSHLIGLIILLLILFTPVYLTILLVRMVRKRKRREALGLPPEVNPTSYVTLVEPLTARDMIATYSLLAILAVVYACEVLFAASPSDDPFTLSNATLLAMGGLSRAAVMEQQEIFRLFTAPFLHNGFSHILCNGIALYFAGRVLEKRLGAVWFLAIYAAGAIGGALFSLTFNPEHVLTVGASGAIMGLFAAIMAVSFRTADKHTKKGLQGFALRVLIPSMLPQSVDGTQIDYAAHAGGMVGGSICAAMMLVQWTGIGPKSRTNSLALLLVIMYALAASFSGFLVYTHYTTYAALGVCVQPLVDTARKTGADPAAYLQQNAAYINRCIDDYIAQHPQ